ncbi:MAG: hypothetical protein C0602_03835 [Denitrovibrio sp.]|nr:MAG: hypothetical protein C0602_03835 [Denitrovibrio sp.]
MNKDDILKMLETRSPANWYHNIEVLPGSGIFTDPTRTHVNYMHKFKKQGLDENFWKGKRILDLGSFSGALSFFFEEAGADVVAVDVQDPEENGFQLLHDIRKSKVEFRRISIYDLDPADIGMFDVVNFMGLFYHLKHPLLAMERINAVCKLGGTLLTVGTTCDRWFHNDDESCEEGFNLMEISEESVKGLNDLAWCGFAADHYYNDTSNWFIPNHECLKGWHKACGFDVVWDDRRVITKQIVQDGNTKTLARSVSEMMSVKKDDSVVEYKAGDYHQHTMGKNSMKGYAIPTSYEVEMLKDENKALKKKLNELEGLI